MLELVTLLISACVMAQLVERLSMCTDWAAQRQLLDDCASPATPLSLSSMRLCTYACMCVVSTACTYCTNVMRLLLLLFQMAEVLLTACTQYLLT